MPVYVALYDIAASAYRAYAASTGNKNYKGDQMPEFEKLPEPIQTAWMAAVSQAIDVARGGSYGLDIEQTYAGWKPKIPKVPVAWGDPVFPRPRHLEVIESVEPIDPEC